MSVHQNQMMMMVCEVNDMLQNMRTTGEEENASPTCANCGEGEESSDSLKACAACKMVKYCSRECQIAHRPKHKKECRKRAAELHDEKLFKHPPPKDEDCPICFLRMPTISTGRRYMSCCGKVICSGCFHANAHIDLKKQLCPFCRTPAPFSKKENIERLNKRVEAGEAEAIYNKGGFFLDGEYGLPQDYAKALELWQRAGELGYYKSYYNIGNAYYSGRGVEMDGKKGTHYFGIAAIRGDVDARHVLGCIEWNAGNMDRARKHWMIAVRDGKSLNSVKRSFMDGHTTKEDYSKALRAYQEYLNEVKSDQRDKAAALDNRYKYIE